MTSAENSNVALIAWDLEALSMAVHSLTDLRCLLQCGSAKDSPSWAAALHGLPQVQQLQCIDCDGTAFERPYLAYLARVAGCFSG